MIIDTIENLGKYVALNPLFADVIEFLKNNDLRTMEEGIYPIKDKNLFLSVQVAKQRTKESAFIETPWYAAWQPEHSEKDFYPE